MWEAEAGASDVQSLQLHEEFEATLGYMRPFLIKQNKIQWNAYGWERFGSWGGETEWLVQ